MAWSQWTIVSSSDLFTLDPTPSVEQRKELREAVDAQLKELGIRTTGKAPVELPKPPIEVQDTYAYAYATAVRNCKHDGDSISTRYDRHEYQCSLCQRYYIRKPTWF